MVLEIFKESLLFNLAFIIIFATAIALVFYKLKQSIMLSYILAGILLGPLVLKLIDYNETLEAFSSFGIAFLLFVVGLNLNLKLFKEFGKVSLVTGIGQIVFTS
ncbi:cation:proton antiporter, partial [Candidatus Woesearchaeota archaeon]|nr:cation:proton antiporter [Candidatus Woesearchaeota archaeon]